MFRRAFSAVGYLHFWFPSKTFNLFLYLSVLVAGINDLGYIPDRFCLDIYMIFPLQVDQLLVTGEDRSDSTDFATVMNGQSDSKMLEVH